MDGVRAAIRSFVRVATAMAIVAAIAAQLQYLADHDLLRTVNFFSFFTIQSNMLAAVVLTGLELRESTPLGRFGRWARGGVTLYMTMTGIVYAVLLAPVAADVSTQLDWVNTVLHVAAPLVVLADWLLFAPTSAPTWRAAALWLLFPIAWLACTLVRGLVVDWYPYPFLDPRDGVEHAAGSWPVVIVTMVVLSVAVAGLTFALGWIARRRTVPLVGPA